MSFNMNLRGAAGSPTAPNQTGNQIPKGYRYGQVNQYTPQQSELFGRAFQHVAPDSYLSQLASGNEQNWDQLEAPAMRQFQELQGNTASRFSGVGGRRSSDFKNQMSGANQDFASNLKSQRMGYQRQALQDLMQMSQMLLGQRPYEQFMVEKQAKKPGFLEKILGGIGSAGAGIGSDLASRAIFGGF